MKTTWERFAPAALFAAAVLAYLPALNGGRILDDDLHITRPDLQPVSGLWRIWFQLGATQQYYPVLHSAFWIEHRAWGDGVFGYHLANVLLHAGAACLIPVIMRRLRLPGGWLAAFVFALHPVCVESVAWIAEQKNTLSTVFGLGAAAAYLRFDELRSRRHYWLGFGLFALSALSKTAVVTIPAALLVVVWWKRGRIGWNRDVRPLLPWFAVAGAVGLVTVTVERRLFAGIAVDLALTPAQRFLVAGRAFWFYLGKVLWPSGLTFFYPRWAVGASGWEVLYPLAAIGLGVGLWFLSRWTRGPLAAYLCFAGTLVPVLGFFNVEWFVFSYVADHLQYLACLGLIIPGSALAALGARRLSPAFRPLAPWAAASLVAALGLATWFQCGRYADPVTFYGTAAELSPDSAVAHNHYGAALAAVPGRMPEAIRQFRIALRLSPDFGEIHENLGTALLRYPDRREEAVAELEAAVRLRPDRKEAHGKLALALSGIPGREEEAVAQFEATLRIDPADPYVLEALGEVLMRMPGRGPDAERAFEAAIRLKPDYAVAENDLGIVLAQTPGRLPEAVAAFAAAVRLDPTLVAAQNNLRMARQFLERGPGQGP
jgi:tetratricopeptide (TPR) repeat protein